MISDISFEAVTVLVMVLVALILALSLLLSGRSDARAKTADVQQAEPDRVFGHDMGWLAVRSENPAQVVETLGLSGVRCLDWSAGIRAINEQDGVIDQVFVSAPVQGWTLVAGLALPQPMGPAFRDKVRPLLARLLAEYHDVQYFLNYPTLDYFSWQRGDAGRFVRLFAATDEGVVLNKGLLTPAERRLGLRLFELRGVRDRQGDAGGELLLHPTEAHVLSVAGAWSLDPSRLDPALMSGTRGFLGKAPKTWRSERLKSSRDRAA